MRHRPQRELLNVHHTLSGRQRSFEDVLVQITFADGTVTTEYASPGRAEYMLARYTPARFEADPTEAYAKVVRAREKA